MINKDLIKQLKKSAHHLKPIILIGQKGLTEAVIAETDIALNIHECIKIKITGWEKDDRNEIIHKICENLQAEYIHSIGHIFVIYRKQNANK